MHVPLTLEDPTFIMGSRVVTKVTSIMSGCYWYHTESSGNFKLRPDGTMRDSGFSFEYYTPEYFGAQYLPKDLFS